MSETQRLVTAEEFERLPEDDTYRIELVEGRLVPMSPVSFDHGRVVAQIVYLINRFLKDHPIGVVVADVGFTLASNPDTVRGPDVAFLRQDRMPAAGTRGFLRMKPDAVFEVLSPEDRPGEGRVKIAEYLDRGVSVVVVIDPDVQTVTTFRQGAPPLTLHDDQDLLDLTAVIPGFTCRLGDIFA
jgi:Uma2 family endonuclease